MILTVIADFANIAGPLIIYVFTGISCHENHIDHNRFSCYIIIIKYAFSIACYVLVHAIQCPSFIIRRYITARCWEC